MQNTEHVTAGTGGTWSARLLVLAMWPIAWMLIQATLDAWRASAAQPLSVDTAVGVAIAALGAAVASLLALSSLPLAIAHRRESLREPAWLRRCTPQLWRRVVGIAVGGAMGVSMATASFATDLAEPDAPAALTVTSAGWVTTPATAKVGDIPTAVPQHTPPSAFHGSATPIAPVRDGALPGAGPSANRDAGIAPVPDTSQGTAAQSTRTDPTAPTVTVRRGDSLWVICADLLPAAATESDIAHAWPLLYRANKAVIGDNPSLIYAGQTLDVPAEMLS